MKTIDFNAGLSLFGLVCVVLLICVCHVFAQTSCVERVYPLPPWIDPNDWDATAMTILLPWPNQDLDDPNWVVAVGKFNRPYSKACHPQGHDFTIRVIDERTTSPTTVHHDKANEQYSIATTSLPGKNEVVLQAESEFGGVREYMITFWGGSLDPNWVPMHPILYGYAISTNVVKRRVWLFGLGVN